MRRSFDNLAKTYASLERLMFGRYLDRTRQYGITALDSNKSQRALVLGDGDGRFSYYALQANPSLLIDSIERSSKMRDLAQLRIHKLGDSFVNRHRYIAADARFFSFPKSEYDIVVVQYFLDCFNTIDANELLENFDRTLKPNGKLVYADFSIPQKIPARWIGIGMMKFLYLFFKLTTDIEANRLPALEWPRFLELNSKQSLLKGLVISEIRTKSRD